MVEEVAPNIYRIPVPLVGNPLRELNSYFIRGEDRELLIDTGFRRKECYEALSSGLHQLGSQRERRDVLVTHFHTDHAGLADRMAAQHGRIYMNEADALYDRRADDEKLHQETVRRFTAEGFDEAHRQQLFEKESDNMSYPDFGDRLCLLQPHEKILYGDYKLENIPVPGHTPGNMMLWAEKQGIMFCGDHVLFDISPNITPYRCSRFIGGLYEQSASRGRLSGQAGFAGPQEKRGLPCADRTASGASPAALDAGPANCNGSPRPLRL